MCLWRLQLSYNSPQGDLGPYLHTIVYRRAIDLIRRNLRHSKQLSPELIPQQLESTDAGPEDHACRAEDAERVRSAISTLPLKIRKPLVLAYYYGLRYPEIAAETGVPLGTVKTRITAARRDLRTALIAANAESASQRRSRPGLQACEPRAR